MKIKLSQKMASRFTVSQKRGYVWTCAMIRPFDSVIPASRYSLFLSKSRHILLLLGALERCDPDKGISKDTYIPDVATFKHFLKLISSLRYDSIRENTTLCHETRRTAVCSTSSKKYFLEVSHFNIGARVRVARHIPWYRYRQTGDGLFPRSLQQHLRTISFSQFSSVPMYTWKIQNPWTIANAFLKYHVFSTEQPGLILHITIQIRPLAKNKILFHRHNFVRSRRFQKDSSARTSYRDRRNSFKKGVGTFVGKLKLSWPAFICNFWHIMCKKTNSLTGTYGFWMNSIHFGTKTDSLKIQLFQ